MIAGEYECLHDGAMRICELSLREAKDLEQFGSRPDCHSHNHLRKEDAQRRVQSKMARFAGPMQRAITATARATEAGYDKSFGPHDDRILVPATSAGFTIYQLLHGGEKRM